MSCSSGLLVIVFSCTANLPSMLSLSRNMTLQETLHNQYASKVIRPRWRIVTWQQKLNIQLHENKQILCYTEKKLFTQSFITALCDVRYSPLPYYLLSIYSPYKSLIKILFCIYVHRYTLRVVQ